MSTTSVLFYVFAFAGAPLLLLVEWLIAKKRGMRIHDPAETADSLMQLVGEAVINLVLGLNVFALYGLLVDRIGLVTWNAHSSLTWALAFVVLDFVYYWGHRACHSFAPLWGLHAVHHQAREMNLSVGLRGPMLAVLQVAPFLVPLALLGVPLSVMFPVYIAHTIYKLLVHTRVVGKLGFVEKILVTPSQHRVHHATNERFLDKNFGGVFAIWDLAFGTYQVEDEAPIPGPRVDFDPIENNLAPWRTIIGSEPPRHDRAA
jgi:sterol desaturase/sphingolipid hydroxylase (fatty acid hydroxylase superfamily)